MTWWYYLIGYYVLCNVILACCSLYHIKKNANEGDWGIKEWFRMLVFGPLVLPIGIILYGISRFCGQIVKQIKEREKTYIFKKKYGFSPDEHYICFSMMGGSGVIVCEECGHKEKIVSFIHGFNYCLTGRQCPNCYAFGSESNVSDIINTFGDAKEDYVCRHCGTIIRKKDESFLKGNDDPLYCPKCHSHKLVYHCEYIT